MTHAEAANAALTNPSTSTANPGVPMTHAEAANAAVTNPSTSTTNPGVPMTNAEAANAAVINPSTSTANPGVPMTHAEAANAAVTDPSTSTANPGVPMTHAEAANAAVTDPTESERELMTDNEESMADTQRMHTPHDAALATLTDLTCELGADEVRVLARIAERLKGGQTAYGPLHLETDRREFRLKEAREEVEDALVYLACAWLQDQEVSR